MSVDESLGRLQEKGGASQSLCSWLLYSVSLPTWGPVHWASNIQQSVCLTSFISSKEMYFRHHNVSIKPDCFGIMTTSLHRKPEPNSRHIPWYTYIFNLEYIICKYLIPETVKRKLQPCLCTAKWVYPGRWFQRSVMKALRRFSPVSCGYRKWSTASSSYWKLPNESGTFCFCWGGFVICCNGWHMYTPSASLWKSLSVITQGSTWRGRRCKCSLDTHS